MIFFGSSRLFLLPLFLFLLIPLLAYSPGLALLVVGVGAVVMLAGRGGARQVEHGSGAPAGSTGSARGCPGRQIDNPRGHAGAGR